MFKTWGDYGHCSSLKVSEVGKGGLPGIVPLVNSLNLRTASASERKLASTERAVRLNGSFRSLALAVLRLSRTEIIELFWERLPNLNHNAYEVKCNNS